MNIPEGFKQDARGNLVPVNNIKAIDLLRDELVYQLTAAANDEQQRMTQFKRSMMTQVKSFIDLSAQDYDVKLGGKKGNISLVSFDGKQKVQIAIADNLQFDERLQVAKQLIDECIHDWSDGTNDRIRTLVEHAFRVDKQGQVSTADILGLRKLEMNDERWDRAMKAIADSIQVVDSKEYIRFYKRADADGQWQAIALDMAAL